MGLVLDSSALIAAERGGLSYPAAIRAISLKAGDIDEACVVCAITVAELAHGLARAQTDRHRLTRHTFLNGLLVNAAIQPVTTEIAYRAGTLDGELAARGLHPGLADLLIASTALQLGYRVVTSNVRHFAMVPGLEIITI